MTNTLFIFGLGYTATVMAKALLSKGWEIAATTRDPRKNESLGNIALYPFGSKLPLESYRFVLNSIPPSEDGDPVLNIYGKQLSKHSDLAWMGYLSSTGVYGNHGGDWVTEQSICKPSSQSTQIRLNVELLYQKSALPYQIFRLAGIYGPGRNALERIKEGYIKRIYKPDVYFSRIHVADAARTVIYGLTKGTPGQIYNVADSYPCSALEPIDYAFDLLGIKKPPAIALEDADLSPQAMRFYKDNKKVSNQKILEELGVQLQYPTYREGLRALL